MIAIEKDSELFEFLKTKFEKEIKDKKLILLNKDILEFEMSKLEKVFGIVWPSPSDLGRGKPRTFQKLVFQFAIKLSQTFPIILLVQF